MRSPPASFLGPGQYRGALGGVQASREGMAGDWFGKPGALGKGLVPGIHTGRARAGPRCIYHTVYTKGLVITFALCFWAAPAKTS